MSNLFDTIHHQTPRTGVGYTPLCDLFHSAQDDWGNSMYPHRFAVRLMHNAGDIHEQ